jgi:mono/diheme cytochrome c family protein
MDTSEQLHLFERDKLKSCETSRESLMPAYNPDMLSDRDLDDIIAYLQRVAAP